MSPTEKMVAVARSDGNSPDEALDSASGRRADAPVWVRPTAESDALCDESSHSAVVTGIGVDRQRPAARGRVSGVL
jgi:hypothetical protein